MARSPTIRTLRSYSTHREYSVDFFGAKLSVTVTPSPSVIRRWIYKVLYFNRRRFYSNSLVVGVGVQWTVPVSNSYYTDSSPGYYSDSSPDSYYPDSSSPSRNYGDSPPPDTLQICVGRRCLIIQLSHCDRVPNKLRSFLANPKTTYVGVWNSQDAGKLERSRHGLEIGKLLDIRNYVQDSQGRSMRRSSFGEIVEECLGYQGVRLDPEISRSDWSVYNLGHDQILQASIDAHVCCKLGIRARLWKF